MDEPTKGEVRRHVLAARATLDEPVVADRADRLLIRVRTLLDDARIGSIATATAYISVDGEPGTGPIIDHLHRSGVRILLPLLCDDFDLAWAAYEPGRLQAGRFGLVEPTTPSLGKDAVADAGVLLCPGIAGTPDGRRLGRGGGSYDRVLARADPVAARLLLLYDDEVLSDVPTEPHDARVDYLVTPTRVLAASPGRPEHEGVLGR